MSDKAGENKSCLRKKTAVKVAIGVSLIALGVAAAVYWWPDLLALVRGCLGLFLIAVGAIFVIVAK